MRIGAAGFFMDQRGCLPGKVRVLLDGMVIADGQAGSDVTAGEVTITTDKLYRLVRLSEMQRHILTLTFLDANIELYAFTFG